MVRCGMSLALALLAAAFICPFASASCPFSEDDHHHHHSDAIIEPGDRPMDSEGKHSSPHSFDHDHEHGHSNHHDHFHDGGHAHHHVHSHEHEHGHHKHSHGHDHAHHHGHSHDHPHDHLPGHDYGVVGGVDGMPPFRLQEEIAEEEELRMFGFNPHVHDDEDSHLEDLSTAGLWIRAMGCSLLVSMASLICLMLLPLIVSQGKPSQTVVDALAAFGAGAMLGDAFLHQLPHALGSSGGHSHSHGFEHPHDHNHIHPDSHSVGGHSHTHSKHSHAHSIQDLSVGLAVLVGIILFFIVEKIVRQVEALSTKGAVPWGVVHHRHHRGHQSHHEKDTDEDADTQDQNSMERKDKGCVVDGEDAQLIGEEANGPVIEEKSNSQDTALRKRLRKGVVDKLEDKLTSHTAEQKDSPEEKKHAAVSRQEALASNLVLGYLNLFSDGVHNFTDGMALGSAFLLHGTIGGWSRTLFLLAHELPQEVGDFGILVRSGFSVLKALAFNFLSALVALAGTALALVMGGSSGQSSWIEGFTAGGFIYIAVAGVLPEMHQQGTTAKTTVLQLVALCLGMGVALVISLVE